MTALAATIIIVNYNAGARLRAVLDHLAGQSFRDFEAVVVDNASTDNSLELARGSMQRFTLLQPGANLGFAAANNLAAKAARGTFLVFLNPDAYPEPSWLAELMAASERHPGADAFGSTQLDAADSSRIDGAGDVFHVFGIPYRGHFGWPASLLPPEGECFAPCAAAAMYRRAAFEALGGFDERFFCYCEDVDLGFRLRIAGGRSVQVASARVRHEGSGISGRTSDFTVYHGHRNRIWTTFKNMPGEIYWPMLPAHAAVNLYLLLRAFSNGTGRAYARALRDGLLGLPGLAAARREIQKSRRADLKTIARALVWSPAKVSRREAVLRPISAGMSIVRLPDGSGDRAGGLSTGQRSDATSGPQRRGVGAQETCGGKD